MAEEVTELSCDSSTIPHYVRITSGGKVKKWVQFCLKFFEVSTDFAKFMHTIGIVLTVSFWVIVQFAQLSTGESR